VLRDALAQPEKCQDCEDDHDEADEVDDTVHVRTFRMGSRIESRCTRDFLYTNACRTLPSSTDALPLLETRTAEGGATPMPDEPPRDAARRKRKGHGLDQNESPRVINGAVATDEGGWI
jgi:hypothetical protein